MTQSLGGRFLDVGIAPRLPDPDGTIDPVDPTDEVRDSARSILETLAESAPRVGVALAIIAVGVLLSLGFRVLLRHVFQRRQTPSFSMVMSKVGGYVLLFLFVLAAIAVTFPSVQPVDLLAGVGFFSVAIGFAFQDILENTLSGILLLFRQPFASGDQIEVGDHRGTVEGITIRETRMTTFTGELIVIPNRDVYKSAIVVQTHHPSRRIDFTVGIGYGEDPVAACALLVEAMVGVAGVAEDPAPEALVRQLGASAIEIEARFWCSPRQHDTQVVLDAVIVASKRSLDAAGIDLPTDLLTIRHLDR